MPQVCVNGSIPGVPAIVQKKGGELSTFNALLGAREFPEFLIRERALITIKYMLFEDGSYASR
jgi:hypothetical protein